MPEFKTETFRDSQGKPLVADITPVLDRFLTRDYFEHWHVGVYQGNTALAEYAARTIRETGIPVAYAKRGSKDMLLLTKQFGPDGVYKADGDKIFINLDKLPCTYFPDSARYGGLDYSDEFTADYERLKTEFSGIHRNFQDNPINWIMQSPNVLSAANETVFKNQGGRRGLLKDAIKSAHMWDRSFVHLDFQIDGYSMVVNPRNRECFDFDSMLPVVKRFGGWIDFSPDYGKYSMNCNFTTTGCEDGKVNAIVQSASSYRPTFSFSRMSKKQEKFADAVYEAFGVSDR